MNPPHDPLTEALRGWRVIPPADPNFRHKVWQRIGGEPRLAWLAHLRSHAAARSMAAIAVVSVAGFTGSALARSGVRADREAIVAAYLVDIDPRAQVRLQP